jgi:hypothetical protein
LELPTEIALEAIETMETELATVCAELWMVCPELLLESTLWMGDSLGLLGTGIAGAAEP